MTAALRRRIFILAACAMVVLIALFAYVYRPRAPRPAGTREGSRQLIISPRKVSLPALSEGTSSQPEPNPNQEAHDPALRLRRERFLKARPLEQHLPYRDHEIGVDIVDLTKSGKLVLLVTYIHSRPSAQLHIQRLLARYHDPGRAYVIRYQPVFK